ANVVGGIWQLKKLNAALANPKLNTENDAKEFGKGHEYITEVFKTSWDVAGTIEKYLSAEVAAWAMDGVPRSSDQLLGRAHGGRGKRHRLRASGWFHCGQG